MRFYRFSGLITNERWTERMDDRQEAHRIRREIIQKSERFNDDSGMLNLQYFVVSSSDEFVGGLIEDTDLEDPALWKRMEDYARAIGLEISGFKVEEVTLQCMKNMLSSASRNGFIDDDDEVLMRFGLYGFNGYRGGIEFGENLIDSMTKECAYGTAKRYLATETLLPELDRIFAGGKKNAGLGHPVHYFLCTDDRDTRREIYRLILFSLHTNRRLRSRRYCFMDLTPFDRLSALDYDRLYKSISGGSMVIRILAEEEEEGEFASAGRALIEMLAETARKYRNQVLTIFCLPRECTRIMSLFREYLGSMAFVEIKEDFADRNRAMEYLSGKAKEHKIRTDKRLFANLEDDHGYLAPELNNIFDEWYDNKLRTGVYPQYKGLNAARKEAQKERPKGTAYNEFMELIGLDSAKKVIREALDYYKAQKLFAEKGMKNDHPSMHMVFTGNPGTAKTTAARLFARIMKENGLLTKGHIVEVGRGDLVGQYVGWTAVLVKKKFQEARGGVLFIDEAYSLVDDRDGMFGDEAINTIVQEMENHRDEMVVIFAGYPDKMEKFLQKNPGLRSRIAFHVPFADYDTPELIQIAELIASQKGVRLTNDAKEKLSKIFDKKKDEEDFGNGRFVRNLLEKARMAQASRLLQMDLDTITESKVRTIEAADIEEPEARKAPKRLIGFSAA